MEIYDGMTSCKFCLQPVPNLQVQGFNFSSCLKCEQMKTDLYTGFNAVSQSLYGSFRYKPILPVRKTNQINSMAELDVDILFNEEGTCPLCSKTFSKKSSLLTHIRNHSAERKFVCSYCNKGFTQAANLRNHERIHTNDRPYVCGDCGKTFTQITNLNNHRRLHTGERPFVCIEPECGRSFAQVTNLNNHMKTHHKVQQYCCNLCPKKFTQVTSLNTHLQAHAGITGYYCPQCPEKIFKQQSQLQSHMKSHGLAFPYECSRCDEKFHQSTHLEQHLKMHDEFKYKCDLCPSSFNQEDLLKKHHQRHIEGRYFKCPVANCPEQFAVKQHLSKHLITGHSHSELPPTKRRKQQEMISSSSLGIVQAVQVISHPHIPLTTTPGRGRPKKNKDILNDLPTMVPLQTLKLDYNQQYRPLHFQYQSVPSVSTAQHSRNSSNLKVI